MKEEMERMLYGPEWFLIGVYSAISAFAFVYFFSNLDKTFNLVFAIGCLLVILRNLAHAYADAADPASFPGVVIGKAGSLSAVWALYVYILLARYLFASIVNRTIVRSAFAAACALSVCILFVPAPAALCGVVFSAVIAVFILYVGYIYTAALLQKQPYVVPFFIANAILICALAHDTLRGINVIQSPFGELSGFAGTFYATMISVVSARQYLNMKQRRLEAQLRFLHAQIQPHFLYNTISTISAYCRNDPHQASELLNYLGTYLRGKFRDENDRMVCLYDEIELVKAYLTIEQARFRERITVQYDIAEDCNVLIPSLSLQPLVENAVKHGLLKRREGGEITLSVKRENGTAVIKIRDNGVGMDSRTMKAVAEGKQDGIGIRNTDERLKQVFGTGVKIVSNPGAGTELTVTIPMNRGEAQHEVRCR